MAKMTLAQRKELRELAEQVKYKVTVRGPFLYLESKCTTSRVGSDEEGYHTIKAELLRLINAKQHQQETPS